MNTSRIAPKLKGEIGAMNGMLCTFSAQMLHKSSTAPSITPYRPRAPPSTIKTKRRIAMAPYREGRTKELMAVKATMMTIGAPMIPARTALSPMTSAPTMLTACPTALGKRSPASRMISNRKWMRSASTVRGNGVACSELRKVISSTGGNISG